MVSEFTRWRALPGGVYSARRRNSTLGGNLMLVRRRIAGLIVLLTLAAFVQLGWAFRDANPESSLAEHARPRHGGVIGVAPRNVDRLEAGDPLGAVWREFRDRQGGVWSVFIDERTGVPTLVSGSGIEWFAADELDTLDMETVALRAREFVDAVAGLLGDPGDLLTLDREGSGEVRPGHWQVVFRLEVEDVRVENARLDFHVVSGRLTMFGGTHWSVPTRSGSPDVDVVTARAILDTHLGVSTGLYPAQGEPELALLAVDADPTGERATRWAGPRGAGLDHRLVWRMRFREPGRPALWTAEIDAHTGEVVTFRDEAHYTAIRGGVIPITPDGDCVNGGCEIDGFPMPFADYSENGAAAEYTDEFGNVICGDTGAGIDTTLAGTYVTVRDECGSVIESGACDTGTDLGRTSGKNCDVVPGASPGNTAAARSGYYHVNRVAEIARFYHPGNGWLEGNVTLNSNVAATCNASWSGEINMYRAGNGCGNTGEIQGVVVHEWGHGYDQNDGGGYDNTSEAYADVVALFAARESCMGRGFYDDGRVCSGYGDTCLSCTGIRDMDYAARTDNTPATPQGFVQTYCPSGGGPCGYETHCEAYPIAEAIYDLATRDLPATGYDLATSWQVAERLWYGTRTGSGGDIYTCALPDSDSCGAGTWYQRMRVADDDDADLANGTPHAAALFEAFARHGMACGLPGDPENQSTSSCPSLATPVVEVAETPGGTELTWPAVSDAAEYLVYRGELGCDRQHVVVARVDGVETSWVDTSSDPDLPRFYRVEAVAANPVCRSAVSACEASPIGPRLQVQGRRVEEVGPNANFNGFADPGETVRIPVTLLNTGIADATTVRGSLRAADPSEIRVLEPGASWPDLPVGATAESVDPHFELTVSDTVACGSDVELQLDLDADGAATRTRPVRLAFGNFDREYVNPDARYIPPQTFEPVLSTIEIPQDRTITELDISVRIDLFSLGGLTIDVTSPQGTTVRLRAQTQGYFGVNTRYDLQTDPDGPGTMDDFVGENAAGTWTLTINNAGGVLGQGGTLLSWTVHASVTEPFDCEPYACPESTPTDPVENVFVDKAGTDLSVSWDGVVGAAGYHVLSSAVPAFDGAIAVAGRTSGETNVLVDADGPALTFFQVRAVNGCNQEGP